MKNQLILLEKIQEIDIQCDSMKAEERECRADIEKISSEVKKYEDGLEAIKKEVDELEDKRRTLENELSEWTDRIKKAEDRLKNIKNEKEFNAVNKETNAAKKEKTGKENELSKLNAAINDKKAALKKEEEKLAEKKAALEEKNSSLAANQEMWEKGLKEKRDEKIEIAKGIPPSLFKKYETIREKRQGIAIVPVLTGTCQGCYMSIPPQAYIQLQKGSSELIFCPHCHRILYWRPAKEETAEKEKK